MKLYAAIITALILTSCAKDEETYRPKEVVVAAQEEKKVEDVMTDAQRVVPYLKAVNRTWDRAIQSCWDFKSEILLVQFPSSKPATAKDDEEYDVGWHIVEKPKWKELGNGTFLFITPDARTYQVVPDVTGLPCVIKDILNK